MDNENQISKIIALGTRAPIQKTMDGEIIHQRAEILAHRELKPGKHEYYVHYIDFNKRLDEWVSFTRIDMNKLEAPKVDKKDDKKPILKRKKAVVEEDEIASNAGESESESLEGTLTSATDQKKEQEEKEIERLRHGGSMTQRPEEIARVKNLNRIMIGQHIVETWYFSPYPEDFSNCDIVYLCEFCLLYFNCMTSLTRHRGKCTINHPPGNEIYRKENISFWELDGHRQKTYCRNLCLLSKLFLDHKTLYYDVDPFLFYVMTENDARGCHIIGYFSKEKESSENYNVACILTLPNHQRKGYGKMLINFSYELSKKEEKVGSPEKPLSDLGLLSYRSYWTDVIMELLIAQSDISIQEISDITKITYEDILHTLQANGLLRYYKGQHVIGVTPKHVEDHKRSMSKQTHLIDAKYLDWKPHNFTAAQLRFL